MTFYLSNKNSDLKKLILNSEVTKECDRMIIISGYIGIEPINELSNLGIDSTVIFGMYPTEGIDLRVHKLFQQLSNKQVNVMYSTNQEIHSKIYVWKKNNKILKMCVGSANFTNIALVSQNREVLVEVENEDYEEIIKYVENIIFNSTSSTEIEESNLKIRKHKTVVGDQSIESYENEFNLENRVCIISFLDKRDMIPNGSGLNWGQSSKGKVNPNDAYIPIRVGDIKEFPDIFPEKAMFSENPFGKKNRQNDPIDVIFDDNKIIACLFEGSQIIDGKVYPNKLSSFPKKSDLGAYFRKRLGVEDGAKVTKQDLIDYGRTDLYIQKIGQDTYYIDFSKDK